MEIINYSGKKSYNSSAARKSVFRKETNRARYASSVIVTPKNYGLKNFLMTAKEAAVLFGKIVLRIVEIGWIVPAVIACIYFPKKNVDEYAYAESFAVPVEVRVDNDWAVEYLDKTMSSFAMETTPQFDEWGFIYDDDGSPLPVVKMLQPVKEYSATVRNGETLSSFVKRMGLSNISTIISLNPSVRDFSASEISGKKLRYTNMDGIYYTVRSGDTLEKIAKRYSGVSVVDLLDVNLLDSSSLQKGDRLFIPGGSLPQSELEKAMGEKFVTPIKAKYYLSSRFGSRTDPISGKKNSFHTGIDMACPTGTPIYASMSGTVEVAGWHNSYGNYVIIKHKDHYQTLYGHMSKILVKKGTKINQGDKIGLVGSTGYSTGPHLHFTVYKNGSLIDPLSILK